MHVLSVNELDQISGGGWSYWKSLGYGLIPVVGPAATASYNASYAYHRWIK